MDNFDDTESVHSYQSDSLQSNASSLTGLSFYGDEFAELRHLINPFKYPTLHVDRSSTPKADLTSCENIEQISLKADLQKSLELNEQYKNDIQNLEKQLELKFYDKIDRLLRNNSRLEGELENANSQITRIIKSYTDQNEFLVVKEKLNLEKEIYRLTSLYSNLQIQYSNVNHEKNEIDIENKTLKVNLQEILTDVEVKNVTIQSLKQKISDQHIELQNCERSNSALLHKLNILGTNSQQSEKSKDWYKSELHQCQNNVKTLEEERIKYRNQVASLNQKISSFNIEISKYKNDIDRVRLQALREKEDLFKKLENINLNCKLTDRLPSTANNPSPNDVNVFSGSNVSFYELTIEDLKQELSRIKINAQDREEEFNKLKQENCDLIAKCLMLQKSLQQSENSVELLENSKKALVKKVAFLKENENEKTKEVLRLKNNNTEFEIELNIRNEEKKNVENTIAVIRDQFLKFKGNYEKVKNEVILKNKEILQLQREKQELFMNNNWTICELEKTKEKDVTIEHLKKDIINLQTHITEQTQKIRDLEFKILRNDKALNKKDNVISEKVKELENYNSVIMQYKALTSDYENKINFLQGKLKKIDDEKIEITENFKIVKAELNKKDLKLDTALKNIEQLYNEHKNSLQNMSMGNNKIVDDYKTLEVQFNSELQRKDAYITDLLNKFKKLESDCENYKKRITDDQKVELLLNLKNASQNGQKDVVDCKLDLNHFKVLNNSYNLPLVQHNDNIEKIVMNFLAKVNMEELKSTVEFRLNYFCEKLEKIKANYEEKMEKLKNLNGEDKIQELEILLQVKNRDMEEKQRKMDRNNRTLLRKVKEHMRGRNSAEKQLKYLQDLYNSLFDEFNTLKLSLSSKEYKIQTLEKLCDDFNSESNKLRNVVLNLEKDLIKSKTCELCLEFGLLKEKLLVLEDLQQINCQLKDRVKNSDENILQLTEKLNEQETRNTSLQEKISSLSKNSESHNTLSTALIDLEIKYSNQNNLIQELSQKLSDKEKMCITNDSIVEGLNNELEQAKEYIRSLSNEIKTLSSNLQQKVEYSEELLQNKADLETDFRAKNTGNQNLIADLKNSIILLQNENETLKSDKFFLRRLSSDLKVALHSYVDNNKNLREHLNLLAKEKQQFNSLPLTTLGDIALTGKYDEKYINRLLEENSTPVGNPMTTEIQDCLSKLREEIFSLQGQIIKKNSLEWGPPPQVERNQAQQKK